MEFFKTLIRIFLLLTITHLFSEVNKNHILYLMNSGETEKAINSYQKLQKETNQQDFEILQQMAVLLLESGAKSGDPHERQLAMFGSGLACSSRLLKILEKGIDSPDMATQLTALHFACSLQDNEIDNILIRAMSSDFLETRIEAAMQMALKKHPCAFGQIQSLMQRLPVFLKPFFPQFFGLVGTRDATAVLKNMLFDEDPSVRVQAIIALAQNKRDDLLYLLRKKIKHASIAEQEALTMAFSSLNDSSCIEDLKKLSSSSTENVRLAASLALYQLGMRAYEKVVYQSAQKNNPFAIISLGKIENSEDFLSFLAQGPNLLSRINASIALLARKDPRSLAGLKELFISKENDLIISPYLSLGKTLNYYQVMINSKKRKNLDLNLSLELKQSLLKQALDLDEKYFLGLAEDIFNNDQNDLIPYICLLLSNLNSDNVIQFLKKHSEKAGAPLIRDYCNLTLYRMNIDGPYFDYLKKWLKKNSNQDLIILKTFSPERVKYENSQYSLSPDQSGYLLIEIFSAIAEKHDINGIMVLVDCLKNSLKLNRYPLAGILLRATE